MEKILKAVKQKFFKRKPRSLCNQKISKKTIYARTKLKDKLRRATRGGVARPAPLFILKIALISDRKVPDSFYP